MKRKREIKTEKFRLKKATFDYCVLCPAENLLRDLKKILVQAADSGRSWIHRSCRTVQLLARQREQQNKLT